MPEQEPILTLREIEDPRVLSRLAAEAEAAANDITLDQQLEINLADIGAKVVSSPEIHAAKSHRVERALHTIADRVLKRNN